MKSTQLRATWHFQALADGTRLRVIRLLSSTGLEAKPGQIAQALDIPPSHLSRHLQILLWAGFISMTKNGRSHLITIKRTDSAIDALCLAVLSMPDENRVFSVDSERFLAIAGSECWPTVEE